MSRQRREELLAYWGIPVHDVVEAIRNNIRVKNQRRQTVTNLGKVEKIEEAFENATRKIKKAFVKRRRSDDKVKDFQVNPRFMTNGVGSLKITEGRVLRECRAKEAQIERRMEQTRAESTQIK